MWAALVRQITLFILTRRGKRIVALVGVILLCFATTLLIDSRMYLSAGFVGLLILAMLVQVGIGYFRQRNEQRERARQHAERVTRRAEATQTRNERFSRAKSALSDVVKITGSSTTGIADRMKARIAGARNRLNAWRSKE